MVLASGVITYDYLLEEGVLYNVLVCGVIVNSH